MFEDKVLIIELLAPSATVVREIVALAHELEMMWWKLLPLKPQPFSRVHRQQKFSSVFLLWEALTFFLLYSLLVCPEKFFNKSLSD